jgi:hypothetical protein
MVCFPTFCEWKQEIKCNFSSGWLGIRLLDPSHGVLISPWYGGATCCLLVRAIAGREGSKLGLGELALRTPQTPLTRDISLNFSWKDTLDNSDDRKVEMQRRRSCLVGTHIWIYGLNPWACNGLSGEHSGEWLKLVGDDVLCLLHLHKILYKVSRY